MFGYWLNVAATSWFRLHGLSASTETQLFFSAGFFFFLLWNPTLSSVAHKLIKSCEPEMERLGLNSENERVEEEEGGGNWVEVLCVCVIKQEMRLLQVAFLIKESNGEKREDKSTHADFFLPYIHCRRRGEVSLIKGPPYGAWSYSAVYYVAMDPWQSLHPVCSSWEARGFVSWCVPAGRKDISSYFLLQFIIRCSVGLVTNWVSP